MKKVVIPDLVIKGSRRDGDFVFFRSSQQQKWSEMDSRAFSIVLA